METGIYQIDFFDGSKWNLYFANSTQHKKVILNIKENKDLIKSFSLIVSGIHTANQIDKIFQIIKDRKTNTTFCLISTSEKDHLELATTQWAEAKNTQIAEVTNTNCKRVLIFIDNKWHYLKNFDKDNLICTVSGLLCDKTTYENTGLHNN